MVGRDETEAVDAQLVDGVAGLQHSHHPLERVLLADFGALLAHNAHSLVAEHVDAEHGDATPVDELHRLNRQHGGDQLKRGERIVK